MYLGHCGVMGMRSLKKEGKPLPETEEMKIWKEEYSEMPLEEHHKRLQQLGLGADDLAEFDKAFQGEKRKK